MDGASESLQARHTRKPTHAVGFFVCALGATSSVKWVASPLNPASLTTFTKTQRSPGKTLAVLASWREKNDLFIGKEKSQARLLRCLASVNHPTQISKYR